MLSRMLIFCCISEDEIKLHHQICNIISKKEKMMGECYDEHGKITSDKLFGGIENAPVSADGHPTRHMQERCIKRSAQM